MGKQNSVHGVIIDSQYKLIGLVVQRSRESQPHPESIATLQNSSFCTRQVQMGPGKFKLANRDSLWGLQIWMADASGNTTAVEDNTMRITARILDKEGEGASVIGYYVRICGREEPMRLEQIIRISGWIRPFNFVVRTDEKTKKRFLASKPGMCNLSDLPAYIGGDSRGVQVDTRTGSVPEAAEAKNQKVRAAVASKAGTPALDIETLVAKVDELGGLLAMAPGEKYRATEEQQGKVKLFKGIGASQIASPKLSYNEKKLNANTNFRKRGQLVFPNDAPILAVDCFMWSTKHLFYNGRNQMDELRILIPADKTAEFESLRNSDFALRRVDESERTAKDSGYAGDPYNTQGMVEYAVRLNKLSIIGFPHPGNEAIYSPERLRDIVYTMSYIKLARKVLNSKLKLLVENRPDLRAADQRSKLCPMYANLSTEQLDYIQSMGVNLSDGSYNPRTEDIEEKDGSESKGGAPAIEIEYRIKGFSDKELTGEAKYNITGEQINLIREYLVQAAQNIEATDDLLEQYRATKENIAYLDRTLSDVKHMLWRHKVAMIIKDGGRVHQADKGWWEPVTTRKAGGVAYECRKEGCEGLAVTMVGTSI